MSADEQFEKLNWEMFEKVLEENPTLATFFGLHEPCDWKLPDGSVKSGFEGLKEKIDFEASGNRHKELEKPCSFASQLVN